MTREEYLNELNKAFGDFKFFPEGHYYEYKGKKIGVSVTKFYAEYEQEFDAKEAAEKKAPKLNTTAEELAEKLGFDISNWSGVNKKLLLRNCVEPEVAEYILECLKEDN